MSDDSSAVNQNYKDNINHDNNDNKKNAEVTRPPPPLRDGNDDNGNTDDDDDMCFSQPTHEWRAAPAAGTPTDDDDTTTTTTNPTTTTTSIPTPAPAALWMSGHYGIGFRIPAGGIHPPIINNQFIPHFHVPELVQQVVALKASWVIVNLSAGAFGDRYISYHPVLSAINPGSTPNNNNNNNTNITDHRIDLWGEVASALHAHGIACIAYVATQGPAMLKHGPTKAYDYDATTGTAPSIQRWHDHVHQQYGNDTIETLQYAFCDIIIQYYAQRYGHLVDGWWFDHAHFGNVPLLHDMVKKYNPHTVVAFNRGRKVPLHNNNPGYEDYTSGHPTPLRKDPPHDMANEPMVTSIEATVDGFFRGPLQELSLGHVFMPMGPTWNGIGSRNDWCHCQAVDWMGRVLQAKGAWTWNLPRQDNTNPLDVSSSMLDVGMVKFLQGVIRDIEQKGSDGTSCCTCCCCSTSSCTTDVSTILYRNG